MVRPQISLAGYGHLLLVLLGSSGSFKSRGLITRYWTIGAVPLKGILDPGPFLSLLPDCHETTKSTPARKSGHSPQAQSTVAI